MPADRPQPLSVHARQRRRRCRSPISAGCSGRAACSTGSYNQYLQPLVDTSRPDWQWRQDNALARTLSPATLREFQRAAQIRDAFFCGRQHPVDQSRRDAAAGKHERRLLDQARHQRHHRGEQGGIELAGFRAVAGHEPRARRHHGRPGREPAASSSSSSARSSASEEGRLRFRKCRRCSHRRSNATGLGRYSV